MKLADFHYDLPSDRIAQEPATPRDASRLMVLQTPGGTMDHRRFHELDQFLHAGDVLVLNSTKVFPARLRGHKKTGGKAEALLLAREADADGQEVWRSLVRGTMKPVDLVFAENLQASMRPAPRSGEWLLTFSRTGVRHYLEGYGEMPLPPYIKRTGRTESDLDRYQTVVAQQEGAVAAPTAGFHFTPALFDRLKSKGVQVVTILLHVGWGTFRPLRTDTIEEHQMLPELYSVSADTANAITQARREKRRVIAVGTTVVRTLETLANDKGDIRAAEGASELFIYPGYRFKAIDALITNFHLPDSTPILLASAFAVDKGMQPFPFALRSAYEEAIRGGYRFYSYGDAMFIA